MALQHHGAPFLLSTGLGTLDVVDRQNPPTEQQIKALAELIQQDGEQRNPILVRQVTPKTYKVVCGATRVLALRLLDWPKVRAQIVSSACWSDYQIAELSDDLSSKQLTREQQAETARKLKELRQKAAAAAGSVEKAKGGRGKRGGVAEAARQAGVSRYTAMRANKPVRNEPSAQVSDRQVTDAIGSSGKPIQAEILSADNAILDKHACRLENSISRALNELREADRHRLIERLQTFLSAMKAVLHDGGAVELPSRRPDRFDLATTVIQFPGAQS
jgi:hypothetical protein